MGVGGSREHFFHFLLGYLLPLVGEQSQRRVSRFGVLDCGPLMNPHLVGTLERLHFSFEVVENRRITRPLFVPLWDLSDWTDEVVIQRAVDRVRTAWSSVADCQTDASNPCAHHHRLLLARSPMHAYYGAQGGAEVGGYGVGRRNVLNLGEVSQYLTDCGVDHALYDAGQHSLACQIGAFSRATHVVGMRGAEWANVIWSSPSTKALVFDPNPPATALMNLLRGRRINFRVMRVETSHVSIHPQAVASFLTD